MQLKHLNPVWVGKGLYLDLFAAAYLLKIFEEIFVILKVRLLRGKSLVCYKTSNI